MIDFELCQTFQGPAPFCLDRPIVQPLMVRARVPGEGCILQEDLFIVRVGHGHIGPSTGPRHRRDGPNVRNELT